MSRLILRIGAGSSVIAIFLGVTLLLGMLPRVYIEAALVLCAAVAALCGAASIVWFVHSLGDTGSLPEDEARVSAKLQAYLRTHEDEL